MLKALTVSMGAMVLAACFGHPTNFQGEAKFPQGAVGCRQMCEADGMAMGGFVYSGEYSTSCVCVPRTTAPGAIGATPAPTAGVIVQVAAAAAAQQRAMMAQQQLQQQQMRR